MMNGTGFKTAYRRLTAGLLAAAVSLGTDWSAPLTASAASDEAIFISRIEDAWDSASGPIYLNGIYLTPEEVTELYYGNLYADSEWFYVEPSFTYRISSTGYVTMITPSSSGA